MNNRHSHQRNANQNYKVSHYTCQRAIIKKTIKNKSWAECREREPCYTVGGNINWCSCYGKTICRFLKKLNIELPYDPAIPFLGMYLKKIRTLI